MSLKRLLTYPNDNKFTQMQQNARILIAMSEFEKRKSIFPYSDKFLKGAAEAIINTSLIDNEDVQKQWSLSKSFITSLIQWSVASQYIPIALLSRYPFKTVEVVSYI
ncbi:hypothetical protein HUJ04_003832 [Dendroctonus ponderosae]|nr:hypothetical protein HUJ04_003832 [Dendroctonus ponderosae]